MNIRHMGITAATCCAFAGIAVAVVTAPAAAADPVLPPPAPVQEESPAPVQQELVQAAAGDTTLPPEGVPHLSSLENLPPGTSSEPVDPHQGRGLSYLRDLWHAVQTQEVSGGDAVLLLTQRPLDPAAAPPAGVPAGPMEAAPVSPPAPTP